MDADQDIQMSNDHILLNQIMQEHELTVHWLMDKVGYSYPHVYRFLGGVSTIPSIVWRAVYEKTEDERIVRLFTGEAPVVAVRLPEERLGRDVDLKSLVAMHRHQVAAEEPLLEILDDGVIDARDRTSLEAFNRNFDRMISTCVAIRNRANEQYRKAVKA